MGILWMAWSIIFGLFEPARGSFDLPFLPGLLFFFVGRALRKAGRREPLPADESSSQERRVGAGTPRSPRPAPRREQRTRYQPEPETRPASPMPTSTEPEAGSEPMSDLAGLEEEILELPPPMTSAEMVAEARRRFGPRPLERPGMGDLYDR